jgi:hypothetical protein
VRLRLSARALAELDELHASSLDLGDPEQAAMVEHIRRDFPGWTLHRVPGRPDGQRYFLAVSQVKGSRFYASSVTYRGLLREIRARLPEQRARELTERPAAFNESSAGVAA